MDRSEQITLITQTYSTDAVGNQIPEEKGLTVFCQVQSVGQGEFFEAGREGLRPEYKVTVLRYEYSGQTLAEYRGRPYRIYRSFAGRGETVELYLERRAGYDHQTGTAGAGSGEGAGSL